MPCSPAIYNSKGGQHIASILAKLEQYKDIICKQNILALAFNIWCSDEQQQNVRILATFTGNVLIIFHKKNHKLLRYRLSFMGDLGSYS
jgi:hypothetical protein